MRGKLMARLLELGGEKKRICIAFSGGVDSALLLRLACDAGLVVEAVTFDSTLQPIGEAHAAARQAEACGARHIVLRTDPLADERVRGNGRDRCYHCKHALFRALVTHAHAQGIERVVDGTNADDLEQYRPGLRALDELGIASPLAECGVRKAQVREMAAQLGLETASKPSMPCLATRFPYGTVLESEALARVGAAETVMQLAGFPVVRVRAHDLLARIELPLDRLQEAVERANEMDTALRGLGFDRVTLDMAGFHSGSFDTLDKR